MTKIAAAEFQPFEYSEWNIKPESEQIHLIIIYRPPYSEVDPVTTSVFLEEFLEFLESTVFTASHLLITRDFNIHIDVTDYPDALRLHDLLESTGLEQQRYCSNSYHIVPLFHGPTIPSQVTYQSTVSSRLSSFLSKDHKFPSGKRSQSVLIFYRRSFPALISVRTPSHMTLKAFLTL